MLVPLLDVLLPPACAACGRPGALLCGTCRAGMQSASEGADRFVVADPGVVVGEALVVAIAAFRHQGPMRRALAALKYTGAARIAPELAALAAPGLHRLRAIAGTGSLVPVPIHRERRRSRGYNQAEVIATSLGRLAGIPVVDALARRIPTTRQHRLDRAARLRNLRRAFAIRPGSDMPATAILVDDIITTLATLETCAAVLRDAGCEEVYGFAVAREV